MKHPRYLPNYVRACLDKAWTVAVVRGDEPVARFAYRCGSRRCPKCRPTWGAQAYARISEALRRCDSEDLVFAVFTFDQQGRYGGRKFKDPAEAMECMPWQKYLRRLKYWARKQGQRVSYVATVEIHANGWPHLNVVFHSAALAELVRGYHRRCEAMGIPAKLRKAPRSMCKMAVDAGWGPRLSMSAVESPEAVAKYSAKVATQGGVGQISAEVTKRSQDPVDAPRGFRTLRSSRRFLPPRARERDPAVTTFLVDEDGARVERKRDRIVGTAGQVLHGRPWPKSTGRIIDPLTGRSWNDWRKAADDTAPGKRARVYRLSLPPPKVEAFQVPIAGVY